MMQVVTYIKQQTIKLPDTLFFCKTIVILSHKLLLFSTFSSGVEKSYQYRHIEPTEKAERSLFRYKASIGESTQKQTG